MSSVNNKYNTSTTAPEVVNMYGAPTNVLKGSIVICVHGLFGSATQLNLLFDNLKTSAYKDYFDAVILDGSVYAEMIDADRTKLSDTDDINKKDITDALLNNLKSCVDNDQTKNYFFKVELKDSKDGKITDQVDSLHKVVTKIQDYNLPIVLLGYSKGGVVNMNYVFAYKDDVNISKLISIGTPHTTTIGQEVVEIIIDRLIEKVPEMILNLDEVVVKAYEKLGDLASSGIGLILNGWVTDDELADKWNSLESRPKVTTIRGDAIKVRDKFISDFVVPDESANAIGFNGITHRYGLKDEMATFSLEEFKEKLNSEEVVECLKNVAEKITSFDVEEVSEAVLELITTVINKLEIEEYEECLKLAHLELFNSGVSLLTHKTTAKYVYFGLYA